MQMVDMIANELIGASPQTQRHKLVIIRTKYRTIGYWKEVRMSNVMLKIRYRRTGKFFFGATSLVTFCLAEWLSETVVSFNVSFVWLTSKSSTPAWHLLTVSVFDSVLSSILGLPVAVVREFSPLSSREGRGLMWWCSCLVCLVFWGFHPYMR